MPLDPADAARPAWPGEQAPPRGRPTTAQVLILAAICALGLLRGLYWVGTTALWSPIDELAHFAYVESLATGAGVPVVDEHLVSDEALEVAKRSPTLPFRPLPIPPDSRDGGWGQTRSQYEGIQGPVYYAAMVGPYWVGRGLGGFLGAVYAVRIATMAVALAAVPITWLLARELFPRRPAAWALSALALVLVNGLNANMAAATNDALVVPLAASATLLFLVALRRRSRAGWMVAGAVFGLTFVTKSTAITLVPVLAVVAIPTLARTAADGGAAVRRLVGGFLSGALVPVLPWLAANLAAYGTLTAAGPVEELTGQDRPAIGLDGEGIAALFHGLRNGFWELQAINGGGGYVHVWEAILVACAVAGLAAALARGNRSEASRLAWLATALPLGALSIGALIFGFFGGEGVIVGRYLYPVLPLAAVLIGAGAVVAATARAATVALSVAFAVVLQFERSFAERYLARVYAGADLGRPRLAPVLNQDYGDSTTPGATVRFDAGCPVRFVTIALAPPVRELDFLRGDYDDLAGLERDDVVNGEARRVERGIVTCELAEPIEGAITVIVPPEFDLVVSRSARHPNVSLDGFRGDPLLVAHCDVAGADDVRFDQRFQPQHPAVGRGFLEGWPALGAVVGAAGAIGAVGTAALEVSRRSRDSSRGRTSSTPGRPRLPGSAGPPPPGARPRPGAPPRRGGS